MTNENRKPVAPGTTKVEPATTQQNKDGNKRSTDKPGGQQQK